MGKSFGNILCSVKNRISLVGKMHGDDIPFEGKLGVMCVITVGLVSTVDRLRAK